MELLAICPTSSDVVLLIVSKQFRESWRHPNKQCPNVIHVFLILGEKTSVERYESYRNRLEFSGNFRHSGLKFGNENRRWHGTARECGLGEKGANQFCNSQTCSLCNIIKTSFSLACFGKNTGRGRFGTGIYTSSTSSKADDYSTSSRRDGLKAVLLNKVVVGKGYKMKYDADKMTAPPAGYDSVLGEKGGSLNYDEVVVYREDAIRPSYLVMYEASCTTCTVM